MFQRVFQREDGETQRRRGHREEKKRKREEERTSQRLEFFVFKSLVLSGHCLVTSGLVTSG